jgi:hypothetical protein
MIKAAKTFWSVLSMPKQSFILWWSKKNDLGDKRKKAKTDGFEN